MILRNASWKRTNSSFKVSWVMMMRWNLICRVFSRYFSTISGKGRPFAQIELAQKFFQILRILHPSLLGGNCSTIYFKLKSFFKRWKTSMVLARVFSKLPLLSMV